MAKIELKTEELIGLLQKMQGDAMGRPTPASPVMGQETPRRGAEESLGMIQTLRTARPVESPVAAGTITERRRSAEEQARLQREQMALQERMAAAARAAARAGSGRGTQAMPQGLHAVAGAIKAATDAAISEGRPFSHVTESLRDPEALGYFHHYGVKMDDALDLAKQYYGHGLESPNFGVGTLGPLPRLHSEFRDFQLGPQERRLGVLPHQSPAIDYLKSAFEALPAMKRLPGLKEAATQDWARHQTRQEPVKSGWYQRPDGSWYYIGDERHAPPGFMAPE